MFQTKIVFYLHLFVQQAIYERNDKSLIRNSCKVGLHMSDKNKD